MSDLAYNGYEFKPGDHWVDEPLESFEHHSKSHICSSEFHALHGVLLGVKAGNITQGSLIYMELALGSNVNGSNAALFFEIDHLAEYGLFTNGSLDNAHSRRFFERSEISLPVVDTQELGNMPHHWSEGVCEGVSLIEGQYRTPAVIMMSAILSSVANGTLRRGDPAYGNMLLRAAKESGKADDYAVSLRQIGEFGFFSSELLRGCEPERVSSVGRIR